MKKLRPHALLGPLSEACHLRSLSLYLDSFVNQQVELVRKRSIVVGTLVGTEIVDNLTKVALANMAMTKFQKYMDLSGLLVEEEAVLASNTQNLSSQHHRRFYS